MLVTGPWPYGAVTESTSGMRLSGSVAGTTVSESAICARVCLCNMALLGLGLYQGFTTYSLDLKAPTEALLSWMAAKLLLLKVISPLADGAPWGIPLGSEDTIARRFHSSIFLLMSYWPISCVLYFSKPPMEGEKIIMIVCIHQESCPGLERPYLPPKPEQNGIFVAQKRGMAFG